MVEITDRESAEAWLKTQPHELQVAFATRCALRSFPGVALAYENLLSLHVLPVARAALTVTVISGRLRYHLDSAASESAIAARSAGIEFHNAETFASHRARAANSAASFSASSAEFAATAVFADDGAAKNMPTKHLALLSMPPNFPSSVPPGNGRARILQNRRKN